MYNEMIINGVELLVEYSFMEEEEGDYETPGSPAMVEIESVHANSSPDILDLLGHTSVSHIEEILMSNHINQQIMSNTEYNEIVEDMGQLFADALLNDIGNFTYSQDEMNF